MNRPSLVVTVLALAPTAALAQLGGGDLPQQYHRQVKAAVTDLQSQDALRELEGAPVGLTQEKLDAFFAGAVAKLTLRADGSYTASAHRGGELVSFRVGKLTVEPSDEPARTDAWKVQTGSFDTVGKRRKVSLTLRGGGREATVQCETRFDPGNEATTFYVGPLNGLLCLGQEGEDATVDPVRVAGKGSSAELGPGS